jgi:hypothetical protein
MSLSDIFEPRVLFDILEPKDKLPSEPTAKDLLPFLMGRMRTKRLRKKFLSNFDRYIRKGFISSRISAEWHRKRFNRLGRVMADQIYTIIGQESFAEKILVCSAYNENTLVCNVTKNKCDYCNSEAQNEM